jgi:multiple sugar transport system substrate-binding protein
LVHLRGITWQHRRAIDPLNGTRAQFRSLHTDVDVSWNARPLSAFEFQPVEELANNYDLIILDHPFMGDIAASECLLDLAPLLSGLDRSFIGPSLSTYRWDNAIYAVPIDAACQVAVYRPDLMDRIDGTPPRSWPQVLELGARAARNGLHLAIAYSGVHSLMTFLTLAASLGRPCGETPAEPFVDRTTAREVLSLMRSLAKFCIPDVFGWNSIALHDAMTAAEDIAYCPAVYCYAAYAEADRLHPLRFADLPGAADPSPRGSTIGGTGLAISARCERPDAALAYASFAARADTQLTFALHHGQPARVEAWCDQAIDQRFGGTYSATRATMEAAWVRPRYRGYLEFQKHGGDLVEQHLRGNLAESALMDELQRAFSTSGEALGAQL